MSMSSYLSAAAHFWIHWTDNITCSYAQQLLHVVESHSHSRIISLRSFCSNRFTSSQILISSLPKVVVIPRWSKGWTMHVMMWWTLARETLTQLIHNHSSSPAVTSAASWPTWPPPVCLLPRHYWPMFSSRIVQCSATTSSPSSPTAGIMICFVIIWTWMQ